MPLKRSNEPVFWGLFGFGGMVIAFAAPALLIGMILAGLGFDAFRIVPVMSHWWGALALFLILFGISFHAMHRIYFTLHDLHVRLGRPGRMVLVGMAAAMSVAGLVALATFYFG